MKLYFHPCAEEEIEKLSGEQQSYLKKIVNRFESAGTSYKHFDKLTVKETDEELFRLKLKKKEDLEINQRIIIDIFEDKYVGYGVEHRDRVYSKEYLEEIKDRMY